MRFLNNFNLRYLNVIFKFDVVASIRAQNASCSAVRRGQTRVIFWVVSRGNYVEFDFILKSWFSHTATQNELSAVSVLSTELRLVGTELSAHQSFHQDLPSFSFCILLLMLRKYTIDKHLLQMLDRIWNYVRLVTKIQLNVNCATENTRISSHKIKLVWPRP